MTVDPKTFSVLDAIKGRSYPTDTVNVYTDTAAIYELVRAEKAANDAKTGEDADTWGEKITSLKARVAESVLRFEMRGYAPAVRDALIEEAKAKFNIEGALEEESEAGEWLTKRTIAESIIRVTNAAGEVDEHRVSVEDVDAWSQYLAPEEFAKLNAFSYLLSYQAFQYDLETTPDFS